MPDLVVMFQGPKNCVCLEGLTENTTLADVRAKIKVSKNDEISSRADKFEYRLVRKNNRIVQRDEESGMTLQDAGLYSGMTIWRITMLDGRNPDQDGQICTTAMLYMEAHVD